MKSYYWIGIFLVFVFIGSVGIAPGQTTAFTYQGDLRDGAAAANGAYDFEFQLFDALSGGNQLGTTLSRNGVTVTNGSFAVSLDFANQFPGASRYLEIHVKLSGGGSFTILTPRQQISNSPYSVRSLSAVNADSAVTATTATNANNAATAATAVNAQQLGGVAAAQYVQTNDSRLSDPRPPTAGSANYIQNGTSQQPSSNFNVSGNGSVGGKLRVEGISNGTLASFGGNGDFQIDANGIVGGRFTILQNGNAGIGVAAPSSKLTVAGTIQSTTGGFKFPDGSVQTAAASSLYQGINMSVNTTFISPGTTFTLIPGMSQTVNVTGNAKLLIQYNVQANAGACVLCSASDVFVELGIDNVEQGRIEQSIANGSTITLGSSWVVTVGPGSHTVDVRGESIGPAVALGACCLPSTLIVQVIPQ